MSFHILQVFPTIGKYKGTPVVIKHIRSELGQLKIPKKVIKETTKVIYNCILICIFAVVKYVI